ncbi:MAG: hypothetical protein ACFFA0_00785 [Promethearchaeota archaeon]
MKLNKYVVKKITKKIIKAIVFLFYVTFIGSLIIGGLVSGIMTIIPDEASKPCYLGYFAHCSFTPFSTLILLAIAIFGSVLMVKFIKFLRKKIKKTAENTPKLKVLIKNK